jgi:hypothetical protein
LPKWLALLHSSYFLPSQNAFYTAAYVFEPSLPLDSEQLEDKDCVWVSFVTLPEPSSLRTFMQGIFMKEFMEKLETELAQNR